MIRNEYIYANSGNTEQKPAFIIIAQRNRNELICVNADEKTITAVVIVRKLDKRSRNVFNPCESEWTDNVEVIDGLVNG